MVMLRLRPGAMRVMGSPTPVTFTLARLWIWKWPKFSINFLISVIKVQKIWRFQAFMPWPTAQQGIWRPYEDQPASLQVWGHQRCCHKPKLAHGLNSVSSHWMPGSHPSPLYYSFPTRLPKGVGENLGTDITLDDVLTILDEHYNNVRALDALNQELFQLCMGEKETVLDWGCTCWDICWFSWCHSQNIFLLIT